LCSESLCSENSTSEKNTDVSSSETEQSNNSYDHSEAGSKVKNKTFIKNKKLTKKPQALAIKTKRKYTKNLQNPRRQSATKPQQLNKLNKLNNKNKDNVNKANTTNTRRSTRLRKEPDRLDLKT
jgi:hypothetical protein